MTDQILIKTSASAARSEYYGRRPILQPGNREWVTVVECTNASGWALPPCMIFKGKVFIESWFDGLPEDWRFEVSPNGWTSDKIGLRWLEKLFIPSTSRTKGVYRLLILDGHGSHLTPKFDEICEQNKVIPICMPAHSSHLLHHGAHHHYQGKIGTACGSLLLFSFCSWTVHAP
ncbi:DDE superfamily endonuclease, CENP-B-like [Penicillium camemberti]|uniref:DDE superfamily endonuclease, CENP-B-like n=1 Tax=Penicillium camemberti (strain FM 013) TaxID=1429867 RepID=A0A0G4PRL3_PENC3|nr:DDE superfamily endonuclease, CENP-B-like [Penicillium camemberti]